MLQSRTSLLVLFALLAGAVAACGGASPAAAPDSQEVPNLRQLPVQAVTVEIGRGSPIPVEVVVSGDWNDSCAQIAAVEQVWEANRIEFSIQTTPADANCPPDTVGIAYRFALPLNMGAAAAGEYTVSVNGVETRFSWPTTEQGMGESESGPSLLVAYISRDGNVWLLDEGEAGPRQLTSDAVQPIPDGSPISTPVVSYYSPAISSDGRYVAARRDAGMPIDAGLDFTFSLLVIDTATGESRQVLDQVPGGFAWKPGSHLLVYGAGVPEGYWSARGVVDSSLAEGLGAIDLDSGSITVLVEPERGFALSQPHWSDNGRYLSFQEVNNYEGSGLFAYYDFETGEYVAWDRSVGRMDWLPGYEAVIYDDLTYAANGEERIYTSDRRGGGASPFAGPQVGGRHYTYFPVVAPTDDFVAYFEGEVDESPSTLHVVGIDGSGARSLGQFESIQDPSWSADGAWIIFSAGPYEAQQVLAVEASTGAVTILAEGGNPAVAGGSTLPNQ